MRVLNLYSGIGGNRKLWPKECEVTAVENNPQIAKVYQDFFPQDKIEITDAHKYLLENYERFDFIWSSPPCQTHSVCNNFLKGQGIIRYPDMKLYEEIILLQKHAKMQMGNRKHKKLLRTTNKTTGSRKTLLLEQLSHSTTKSKIRHRNNEPASNRKSTKKSNNKRSTNTRTNHPTRIRLKRIKPTKQTPGTTKLCTTRTRTARLQLRLQRQTNKPTRGNKMTFSQVNPTKVGGIMRF